MITVILTIHIILALSIICAVLLQKSEGGGLGIGGSGGAGGGFMTARGTANLLTKITAFLGACFFLTSILLALLSSSNNTSSIAIEVEKAIEKNEPIVPAVPLGN
jgi:preprotein translocase subunit SecG|tara:strand:+ start:197 stop:511 length:315 start_codon:yes stop_codon:yes gene_type:complete